LIKSFFLVKVFAVALEIARHFDLVLIRSGVKDVVVLSSKRKFDDLAFNSCHVFVWG